MYIYQSHMGGLFASEDYLDYDECYCEECGDSDSLIGQADTKEEVWELLKPYTDINGSGGFDYDYVYEFIENLEE